jgi:hypothetical protein
MGLDYEIIEKYLNKELSSTELDEFNKKLNTDDNFKQEVALYKEVNLSLKNKYKNLQKEEDLKVSLKGIGNKHFQKEEKSTKSIPLKSYFLRISSIAAILIISFFLLKPQTSLYDQFAEHSNLEIQVKGDNDESLLNAAELYNTKSYTEVIPVFKEYLKSNPTDYEIQMSLGIALLETDKSKEAFLIFEIIYKQDNVFKNKATWYLALVNVKTDRKEIAKVYLESIPKDSFYAKKAKKLLNKL